MNHLKGSKEKGVSPNVLGNSFSAQMSMEQDKAVSCVCAQPSRVEALGSNQDAWGQGARVGRVGAGQGLQLLQGIQVTADLGEDSIHCAFGIDLWGHE